MPNISFQDMRDMESRDVQLARSRRHVSRPRTFDVGLALSGGGIRSSTFALGVLQGLAKSGVLREIDYISSVSGGGYIASWLCKQIRSLNFEQTCALLTWNSPAVTWLRRSMSYLRSPASRHRTGSTLFFATYIHNLFSNIVSLLAIAAALLLAPRIILSLVVGTLQSSLPLTAAEVTGETFVFTAIIAVSARLARHEHDFKKTLLLACISGGSLLWFCMLLQGDNRFHSHCLLAFCLSLLLAAVLYVYWNRNKTTPNFKGRAQVHLLVVWGILIWGIWMYGLSGTFYSRPQYLFVNGVLWLHDQARNKVQHLLAHTFHLNEDSQLLVVAAGAAMAICGLVMIAIARLVMKQSFLERMSRLFTATIAGAIKVSFSIALLAMFAWYLQAYMAIVLGAVHSLLTRIGVEAFFLFFCVLIPCWMIVMGMCAGIGMILLGRTLSPYMRENVTDIVAMVYKTAALCLAVSCIAVYGPLIVNGIPRYYELAMTVIWGLSITAAWTEDDKLTSWRRSPISVCLSWWAKAAPYVFLAGFLLILSAVINRELFAIVKWKDTFDYFLEYYRTLGTSTLWLSAGILLGAALFSARSGVNSSSMHRYYLARLAETFLGEAPSGAPEHFGAYSLSGLPSRRLRLHELRATDGYEGPVLLLNTCLNARSRRDPRARLGENFVFSPHGCGFFANYDVGAPGEFEDPARYAYAGEKGISVASCMAISGSALGSNMGSRSSLRSRLFHSVLNARLGWWFSNPRYPGTWDKSIPRSRISCYIKEIRGNMTSDDPFLYLSDGGHFENIGVYELIRRRCRIIIACDASQDSGHAFASLANAIAKARMDFNARIEFDYDQSIYQAEQNRERVSVGRIIYSGGEVGALLYIKPEVLGTEPVDVLSFSRTHPEFPNDPTVNQWFSEAQFEAYRELGELSGQSASGQYWQVAETIFAQSV